MIELFKALGDETRLRILSLVLKEEICVCEIECILKLTQSNTSRHLNCLKRAGIVNSIKKAQWVYYSINKSFVEENEELFKYLIKNIKNTKNYSLDCKELQKAKSKNLCDCNKEREI